VLFLELLWSRNLVKYIEARFRKNSGILNGNQKIIRQRIGRKLVSVGVVGLLELLGNSVQR
jgi:hypothetical protein